MEYHSAIKSNEILIHASMDKPWKQYAGDRNQSQKKRILNIYMYLHCLE